MATLTLRDEVRQVVAGNPEPMTRPEIFAACKQAVDERRFAAVLWQLTEDGSLKRVGERQRDKGAPLALYASATGESGSKAPRSGSEKPRSTRKPGKRSGGGRAPARKKAGSRRVPKVQRNAATSRAPEGFRCGIYSDGQFAICAAEGQITLSEPETRAMFGYLERVLATKG